MLCSQKFTKGIGNLYFMEGNQLVGNGHIIFGEADIGSHYPLTAVKAVKLIGTEHSGQLSCAVGTEVKEDHGIAGLDGRHRRAVFHYNRGNYELIGHTLIVGILDQFYRIGSRLALAPGECLVGKLYTICLLYTSAAPVP